MLYGFLQLPRKFLMSFLLLQLPDRPHLFPAISLKVEFIFFFCNCILWQVAALEYVSRCSKVLMRDAIMDFKFGMQEQLSLS